MRRIKNKLISNGQIFEISDKTPPYINYVGTEFGNISNQNLRIGVGDSKEFEKF
jgi:hypothetical protein